MVYIGGYYDPPNVCFVLCAIFGVLVCFMLTLYILYVNILNTAKYIFLRGFNMASVKVQITIDEELLSLVDQYAKDNYTSRSGVIAQATSALVNSNRLIRATQDMAVAMRQIADEGKIDEESVKQLEDIARVLTLVNQQRSKW